MFFKNIANFNNTNDYLPLLNATIMTDIIVILLTKTDTLKSHFLKKWYSQYNLSAVIADVLIIVIGLIIARALYYYVFNTFSIVKFTILAVTIQIIHDLLFYAFFSSVPRGMNQMLDNFKDYAKEASYRSILGDSAMMIMSCLLGSILANDNTNTNIIVLISFVYLLPYFLYM
jgi:uncharacterized protein YacL